MRNATITGLEDELLWLHNPMRRPHVTDEQQREFFASELSEARKKLRELLAAE